MLSARSCYVIRLDDIAPNMRWSAYALLKPVFIELGIQPLLGVIPDNRDPSLLAYPSSTFDFWSEMRSVQSEGWGIAQHGFQHKYVSDSGGLLNRAPRSEFAGLAFDVQKAKLIKGKAILESEGLHVDGFMAPSHSFDRLTLRALREVGIGYVTDGIALFPYRFEGLVLVPQLLSRPRPLPFGVYTICIHLNTASDRKLTDLVHFLRTHRKRVISFQLARELVPRLPGSRLAGLLLTKMFDFRSRSLGHVRETDTS